MSSISALTNSALQQGVNQILSSTAAQDASGTSSPANTSSTTVSLGNGVAAPLTYNSRGQINATQLAQIEQTVTASIDNTLSSLFSASSANSSAGSTAGSLPDVTGVTFGNNPASQANPTVLNVQAAQSQALASLFASPASSGSQSTNSGLAALVALAGQQSISSVTQTHSATGTQHTSGAI